MTLDLISHHRIIGAAENGQRVSTAAEQDAQIEAFHDAKGGEADSDEFLWPDGSKWLHRNWDGVGPEFGASPLDHDGDADPDVVVGRLAPGESTVLNIGIEPMG